VHRDLFGRRCLVGSFVRGLGGSRNGDGSEYRFAHGLGEPRVAFLGRGSGESERDAGTRGVDQVRGVSNINTEPPGLGDAGHEALQERNALRRVVGRRV
jgi:hypothetical protein